MSQDENPRSMYLNIDYSRYLDEKAAPWTERPHRIDTDMNPGFARMFAPNALTLGVFFPIETFEGHNPTMRGQENLARRVDGSDFAALWFRDVPLLDPTFGDVGQIYDPWVYLGYIAALTENTALATGSIVLPLRAPLDLAKAAASADQLSKGRLVLGVASGDRPVEYPAFGADFDGRGERFRETVHIMRRALGESFPDISSPLSHMSGADLVPKPVARSLPMLVTGGSRQPLEWTAEHADGWITYPRPLATQTRVAEDWRRAVEATKPGAFKPLAQSLYIDLAEAPGTAPTPIHLGFRAGRRYLIEHLEALREAGVNHATFNLKYGRRPAGEVLEELIAEVAPKFPAHCPR